MKVPEVFATLVGLALLASYLSTGPAFAASPHLVHWGSTIYGQDRVPPDLTNVVEIAAGGSHLLALTSAGKVVAWGYNLSGQTNVPPDLGRVVRISAGYEHNVVLLEDGTVRAWGEDFHGECTVPVGLRARAVGAGGAYSAAIDLDGNLVTWGAPGVGQGPPIGFTNLVRMAAGNYHVLAERADGVILTWSDWPHVAVPAEATNAVALAAGSNSSFVLRADGAVITWGSVDPATFRGPVLATNAVAVDAAGQFAAVVWADGRVGTWGYSPMIDIRAPVGLTNVVRLAVGDGSFFLALGERLPGVERNPVGGTNFSGTSRRFEVGVVGSPPLQLQWQRNGLDLPGATASELVLPRVTHEDAGAYRVVVKNHLGSATSSEATLEVIDRPPRVLSAPTEVTGFVGGPLDLSVTWEGSLPAGYAWRLGDRLVASTDGPRLTSGALTEADAGRYTLEITNAFGAVTTPSIEVILLPVAIWGPNATTTKVPAALTNAVAVVTPPEYNYRALALLRDGGVVPWGTETVRVPAGATNLVSVAAGVRHYLGLRADGTVIAWGPAGSEVTSVPQRLGGVVGIAAGWNHSLALRWDGTMAAWGDNTFSESRPPAGLADVVAIAAGGAHSAALRRGGRVVVWGHTTFGEASVPDAATNLVAITSGLGHLLALRRDGRVFAWGLNDVGQCEVPSGISNAVEIAAGATSSLALLEDGRVVAWGDKNGKLPLPPASVTRLYGLSVGGRFSLGMIAASPRRPFVAVRGVRRSGERVTIDVDGVRGDTFRLESTESLPDGPWDLGIPEPGGDGTRVLADDPATEPRRFYRVRRAN